MTDPNEVDPAAAEREVRQIEAEIYGNPTKRAAAGEVLAPEFWETNQQGKKVTRDVVIARLDANQTIVDEYPIDDTEVRVYGNVAISTGHYVLRGRARREDGTEQPFTREARFVHIWVKRDGRWQTVYGQDSPVAGA